MEGFFSRKETQSKTRPDGKVLSCLSCGLYKNVLSPKMKPYGNFKKQIMVIGEAPGETEDRNGKPWQGKAGRILQREFTKLGCNLFEDCISLNSANCRPIDTKGNNRTPTPFEIDNCRIIVMRAIEKYKPKVIILLGNLAILSVIGHRWKKDLDGVHKWRGFRIPDQEFKAWICPTYHPSYIMREDKPEVNVVWHDDLSEAIKMRNVPFLVHKEPEIEIISDLTVLNTCKFESKLMVKPQSAFDIETTGLKPHAKGHKIICASITTSPNHVYSFMIPDNKYDNRPFIRYLLNEKVSKIASNMKFEDTWISVIFGRRVKAWGWDTMLAAHVLDNRPGITSIKFQTYVNFGIIDYASEVAPYLKGTNPDSSNSFNRLLEYMKTPKNKEKVLRYCGYDSIYEYRVADVQRDIMINLSLPF